jgi:hypothetical protein
VTRFLAALRRFFHWFTVDAEVDRLRRARGEVAEVPATCACGAHDLLGRPLPDPDPFDQDADVGERLADEIEDYLRSIR